jgi:predicted Na+-dependent transporter
MLLTRKYANILHNINNILEHMIPVTTPLGIILGLIFPEIFIHLRPFVPWMFGLITFSGALKLRAAELGASVKDPVPILLFFAAAHILMPVIAMFVTSVFFTDTDIISGFVLLFSGPTAVSGFIWVSILKGDMALCLTLILLDTLLAPLVVPGSVSILMGAKVTMDMSDIAFSLLFMVVIPTIIGITVNETSKGKVPSVICPWLNPFAKICLMAVVAANAAAIAPSVQFNDPLILKVTVFVIILTVIGFLLVKLTAVIGKCRYPKDISMIIAGGLRNNSAIMTIAVTFFPEAAVLPTLASIVVQQTIAAVMGKIFSKSSSAKAKVNPDSDSQSLFCGKTAAKD